MTRKKLDVGNQQAVVDSTAAKAASLRPKKQVRKKKEIDAALHPSIEKQWARVRSYRDDLANEHALKLTTQCQTCNALLERNAQLECSWRAISGSIDPEFARVPTGKETHPPFTLAMMLIGAGIYPPPELLLTILDLFRVYMDNPEHIDVEKLFFGKSVQRSGSYAVRSQALKKDLSTAISLELAVAGLKKKPKNKAQQRTNAAEAMLKDPKNYWNSFSLEKILHHAAKGRKRKRK